MDSVAEQLNWKKAILDFSTKQEEISADIFNISAVEERSHNELDKPQESTIKNKLRNSAIDGIDAVINYVVSITNKELEACYEHLRTV